MAWPTVIRYENLARRFLLRQAPTEGGGLVDDLTATAAAEDYLRLRRSLGHELAEAHRLLPRFVAYLEFVGAQTVTARFPVRPGSLARSTTSWC